MGETRKISVLLGVEQALVGDLIVEVHEAGRTHSVFKYDQGWLENPNSFALSPSIPLRSDWSVFSEDDRCSLPPPIDDTAADNWGRSVISASMTREPNELEILLAANDQTRTGALRYADEHGVIQSASLQPVPRIEELGDLKNLIRRFESGGGDKRAAIAHKLRGSGDSLGGARPKSAVYDGEVLSIAKYTSEHDTMQVEPMEVATLRLAKRTGLRVPNARLVQSESDYPVAIIHRFDRIGERRVHYISGRSFLNVLEPEKAVFYTNLVDGMRRHCGNYEQCHHEVQELYRRVMFMILVSNTDNHMKNHGFLLAGNDRWVLSPAFDINPQPYRHRQLKTGISDLSGNEASIEALIEAAPFFDIEEDDAADMAFDMATVIQGEWRSLCAGAGMSQREINTDLLLVTPK